MVCGASACGVHDSKQLIGARQTGGLGVDGRTDACYWLTHARCVVGEARGCGCPALTHGLQLLCQCCHQASLMTGRLERCEAPANPHPSACSVSPAAPARGPVGGSGSRRLLAAHCCACAASVSNHSLTLQQVAEAHRHEWYPRCQLASRATTVGGCVSCGSSARREMHCVGWLRCHSPNVVHEAPHLHAPPC